MLSIEIFNLISALGETYHLYLEYNNNNDPVLIFKAKLTSFTKPLVLFLYISAPVIAVIVSYILYQKII